MNTLYTLLMFVMFVANCILSFSDEFLFRLMICYSLLSIALILNSIKDGGKK